MTKLPFLSSVLIGGLIIALVVTAVPCEGQSQGSELSRFPALMDTLMGGYYGAADSICLQIEAEHPGHPVALYAKATVIYARVFDFEDTTGLGKFTVLTDSCARLADQQKDTASGDAKAVLCYLRGSALASKGLMFRHQDKLLQGLAPMLKAGAEFDNAIQLNPQFYDAYLGRGAYRYAVATNTSILRWLPFIPSKSSGWRDLWLAVDSSKYSSFTALSSMVWFVMDEGNYTLADSICQAGLRRFPDSRIFLLPLLSLQVRLKHWAEAESIALALLNQFLNQSENNGYDPIGLYWRLMICADEQGKTEQALSYARAGLNTYRTAEAADKRQDKLRAMADRLR